MRSKFKWIFTLLLALSMQFSFAQEKPVTGVVSDATGPIPGVNIVVKGTNRSTQTDIDGKYTINAKQGEILIFSFVGMNNTTATVGASNSMNVKMQDGLKLEEVVVDGYRSTTKKKSSVAQTTITAKNIQDRPNVSFLQSLQAQVPGLNISTSSGSPGTAKIQSLIRGISSLNGSTEPLIVVDGIPSSQAVFRSINSEDIESATVLKDAAATAIYGNRGASGVIVIKTKGGKLDSDVSFRYSSSTGFTTLQDNDYNILDSKNLLTLERTYGAGEGSFNPNTGNPYTDAEIDAATNTKWKDIFFTTGISKSHNLSMSQGSSKMTNFTSLGYFDQQGIVPGTDFKRFSLRSNFTGKSTSERFSYTSNIYASYSKRNQLDQETRTDINANILQNPLQGLLTSLPYLDPAVYVNGQQLFDDFGAPSFQITPYMLMDYLRPGNIPSTFNETKLVASLSGSYKLNKELTFTSTGAADYAQENRLFARAPGSYLAIVAASSIAAPFGGIETQSTNRDFAFTNTNKLNFNKTFNEKHTIDANAFVEYTKYHRTFFSYTQSGLDPRTWSPGAGTGYVPFSTTTPTLYRPTVQALKRDAGLFSYFGTVDYDYDSRFGIAGTIRRDASYKFIDDNKWGTFYSVAGRWNMDKEAFMNNSVFKELKLRASYGTNGNQNVPAPGSGVNPNFLGSNLVRDTNSSQSGYGNAASLGIGVLANPAVKWETTTQLDLGVDFNVSDRLTGSIDFYNKKTTDLFDDIQISAVTGQYSIDGNNGSIQNRGLEVGLKYDFFKNKAFKLDVYVNGAYNKATYLTTLQPNNATEYNGNFIRQVDGLIYEYNLVPLVGVNPANGNLLFLDINGNETETVTDADRRATGKSYLPVYQGGFGLNASYNGFFVSSQFSFAAEVYRFDFDLTNLSDPGAIGVFPVTADLLNAWTPTNTNTNVPSLTADSANLAAGDTFSDRWLQDASYIRLKALTFGYMVPSKFLNKTLFQGVKIYSQMENYITWTKWRGLDPESSGASNQGGYPAPKVISFGLDLQF